jgi:predicted RNA polymerase sigma factor
MWRREAFVRAAARWGRVGAYDLPEAGVRRVAIRLACNELRRVRRGLSALLRLRLIQQDGPSEDRPALVTALRDLPLRYRQVLVLHYLADLPVQQVAAELGLPQGTVATQLAGADAATYAGDLPGERYLSDPAHQCPGGPDRDPQRPGLHDAKSEGVTAAGGDRCRIP